MIKRILYIIVTALAISTTAKAQFDETPAFPGAEGFGRYTKGARNDDAAGNMAVYHVTNLEDSGTGSFRAGATVAGRKIIVFDVSGTIKLKSDLKIASNKTILGQTAPGDGICVADYPVIINGSDVIIRYMRFRLGDVGAAAKAAADPKYDGDDALSASHHDDKSQSSVIIDHCSISWSTDECASFYGNTDFTFQYCIISESLRNSVHGKGKHGYGGIWGGESASFHHNLVIHHDSRNVRFDHDYVSTQKGPIDYVNNVVYNWGQTNSTYGGESGNGVSRIINMVNNYYKPGPATKSSIKTRLLNPTTSCGNCTSAESFPATTGYVTPGKFYINGNYMYGSEEVTNDNLCDAAIDPDKGTTYETWKANYVLTDRAKSSDSDFGQYNVISMHSAETAFSKVLHYAGASYKRDEIDRRLRYEALNGLAYYEGSSGDSGSKNGIIDTPSDVGGYPELASEEKPIDTDNDGMPDEWETAHGLNKNLASDALTFTICENDANNTNDVMYTNLEVYANSLVQEITQKERNDATETFEEYYPLGLLPVGGDDPFPTEPDFEIHDKPATGNDVFNSAKATTKNEDISGTSCTLGGGANPSGTDGTYLKLRTNADWVFTVKDGYKITGIDIKAYQHGNNTSTESVINMTSLTADGGANMLDSDVSLPLYVNKSNPASVTFSELSVTNNITVKFTNDVKRAESDEKSAQMQCYAIVAITYEKATGIEVVNAATNVKTDAPAYYYNLQGQRVAPGTKGIVIYKGMKFFNP